jgi:hypothetical protein
MANERKEAPPDSADKPGKSLSVRWAWVGLSLIGLLVPLGWLLLTSTRDRAAQRSTPAAPVAMGGRPNLRLDSLSDGVARFGKPDADEPSKPAPPAPGRAEPQAPEPIDSDTDAKADKPAEPRRQTEHKDSTSNGAAPRRPAKLAKPAKDPAPRPESRKPAGEGVDEVVARGPNGPAPPADSRPSAPAPPPPTLPSVADAAPPPATKTKPPARAGKGAAPKPSPRTIAVSDAFESGDTPPPAAKPTERQGHQAPGATVSRESGIGLGTLGTIGHGPASGTASHDKPRKKVGGKREKGSKARPPAQKPSVPQTEEAKPDDGSSDDAEVASLKPGWFGTKIPSPMNLGQATSVYVTVTREENKVKGRAKLEAMPATPTPAKIQEDEIQVGKFLRVELRALQSEFEIQAISSPEQRLIPGKVTTWQWKVVPQQAGPRELSVVVTNLTDVRGQPIDLTVHSVTVEVEADTLHKLKSVGSLLSSAMGGLMSLFGMYKGILAPLLARRREKDGDSGKSKDKDKGAGSDGGKGSDDKPIASSPPGRGATESALPEPPLTPPKA